MYERPKPAQTRMPTVQGSVLPASSALTGKHISADSERVDREDAERRRSGQWSTQGGGGWMPAQHVRAQQVQRQCAASTANTAFSRWTQHPVTQHHSDVRW